MLRGRQNGAGEGRTVKVQGLSHERRGANNEGAKARGAGEGRRSKHQFRVEYVLDAKIPM